MLDYKAMFRDAGVCLEKSIFRPDDSPDSCALLRFVDMWFPNRRDLRILEIGTCHGISAALLAMRGDVVTLDLTHKADVDDNLTRMQVADRVTCLYGKPAEVRQQVRGPFDMAFIDGEHSYNAVRADIAFARTWARHVVLHDYFTRFRGVMQAIDEAARERGCIKTVMNIFAGLEFQHND